jgi:MarR family transcriptional regulator, organic hydroperoxide resistance regulator
MQGAAAAKSWPTQMYGARKSARRNQGGNENSKARGNQGGAGSSGEAPFGRCEAGLQIGGKCRRVANLGMASMKKSRTTGRMSARPDAPISEDELAARVLVQLREVLGAARIHPAAVKRSAGVSGAQLRALWELHGQPGLRISDLTQRMALHQSTVSNLVEKMSGAGLVLRGRHPHDGRVVRLRLSVAGKKVVARAPKPARGVLPDALSRMPRHELRLLQGALQSLIGAMKAAAPRASKTRLEDL